MIALTPKIMIAIVMTRVTHVIVITKVIHAIVVRIVMIVIIKIISVIAIMSHIIMIVENQLDIHGREMVRVTALNVHGLELRERVIAVQTPCKLIVA